MYFIKTKTFRALKLFPQAQSKAGNRDFPQQNRGIREKKIPIDIEDEASIETLASRTQMMQN